MYRGSSCFITPQRQSCGARSVKCERLELILFKLRHYPLIEWFDADEMLAAMHDELADGDLSSFVKRIADDCISLVRFIAI
jgi:hypothetical protein